MLQNILIHSKIGCPYCEKAKTLLESVGVSYREILFDPASKIYAKKTAALILQTGHKTFPQIFVDNQFIGGFDDLKQLIHKPSFLTLYVVKRNGKPEKIVFDKIVRRIDFLANYPTPLKGINSVDLAQSIFPIKNNTLTSDIDELLMSEATSRGTDEPDYLQFAGRLCVNNLHKKTRTVLQVKGGGQRLTFRDKMELLYRNVDERGQPFQLIDKRFFDFICRNQKSIEQALDYQRDYRFDYFGIKTLENGYLLKAGNALVETPQDAFMRVSIFFYYKCKRSKASEKLRHIFECYRYMSNKYFTHASPTIFNAGLVRPGCISCFLLDMDDSTEGIAYTLGSCMHISKACGGIAFSMDKLRSDRSVIRGSNGRTKGIVPFIKAEEAILDAFNQSSKRKGSAAIYLSPHHPDIVAFLRTKLNTGNDDQACKDISIALWISDLFMKRVEKQAMWSLFNPLYHPELNECYGEEYERLYCELEEKGEYESQVPARTIWELICRAQGSSGMPYILFKDQINRTSNQKNIGIVRSSNLCTEIVEVSDYRDSEPNKAEFACCTLASIALPEFVVPDAAEAGAPRFDFELFEKVIKIVVRNLNNVVDETYYPTKDTERANRRHRPLGIGVQGLADLFCKFKVAFDSPEAAALNARIFEHLYYFALKASNELAREIYDAAKKTIEESDEVTVDKRRYETETLPLTVGAYSSFEGSPLSQGILNFDYYLEPEHPFSIDKERWDALRADVVQYGARNSLLIALMPTASTSQILGNREGFEPITNNVYLRKTLAGEYLLVDPFLTAELKAAGLWTPQIVGKIKEGRGSIAAIEDIPSDIRARFKTVWEMKQSVIIKMAADRQRFVDQSQSMNLHFSKLTLSKFTTAMFMGWRSGLKTGLYYMRTQQAAKPDTNVATSAHDCCSA